MNHYNETAKNIKSELTVVIQKIFKLCSNELVLELEKENLLEDPNNTIQSSTAIGFCIEEFLIKKLKRWDEIKYKRVQSKATINSSADLIVDNELYTIMVNIKVENSKSKNNAISALKQLIKDYVETEPNKEKLYFIFKIFYDIKKGKIIIKGNESYFLEQIHFEKLKMDGRNWSANSKGDNGRLQYSTKKGLKNIKEICYTNTYKELISYRDRIIKK